jgi:hypothetical protein
MNIWKILESFEYFKLIPNEKEKWYCAHRLKVAHGIMAATDRGLPGPAHDPTKNDPHDLSGGGGVKGGSVACGRCGCGLTGQRTTAVEEQQQVVPRPGASGRWWWLTGRPGRWGERARDALATGPVPNPF